MAVFSKITIVFFAADQTPLSVPSGFLSGQLVSEALTGAEDDFERVEKVSSKLIHLVFRRKVFTKIRIPGAKPTT
jgi:hypothetical protein